VKKVLIWLMVGFISLFGVLIVLGMIADAVKSPEQKAAEATARQERKTQQAAQKVQEAQSTVEALPEFTAADIANAYDSNTVAADQQFKDKKFKVTGVVSDINTDFMGNPYITLQGGLNQFMEPQFKFDKSQQDALAKLRKGDKVTVACTGKGDVAKIPMSDSCILL
jgi:ribosomal protein S1